MYKTISLDVIDVNKKAPIIPLNKVMDEYTSPRKYFIRENSYSSYLSNVTNISNKLTLMLSLRADYYVKENVNNKPGYKQLGLSPKIGATYQILEDKVSLFVNYNNGFRNLPDFINSDGSISRLNPESANQLEGGLKLRLFDGKLSSTISYYDIQVKNLAYNKKVGSVEKRVQDGTRESKGFEVEVISNPFPGFNIIAGYSYNDNKNVKTKDISMIGKRGLGTSKMGANLWASYTLFKGSLKGLGFGFGGIHASDAYVDNANTVIMPSYTKLNSTLFFENPKYRVSFKIDNILNQKYWISDGYYFRPQKPLNFVLGVSFKNLFK